MGDWREKERRDRDRGKREKNGEISSSMAYMVHLSPLDKPSWIASYYVPFIRLLKF